MVADKRYTVVDSAGPAAAPVHSSVAVTAPRGPPSAADLMNAASAVSVVAVATSVVASAGVSVGVGGWGFSASYCPRPGARRGWGPSDCRSPWSSVCWGSAWYQTTSAVCDNKL